MAGRPRRRARLNRARMNASQGHPWKQDWKAMDLARRLGLSADETILTDVAEVKRWLRLPEAEVFSQAQRYKMVNAIVLYPPDRYVDVVDILIESDGDPMSYWEWRPMRRPPWTSDWKVMFEDEELSAFMAALMAFGGGPLPAPAIGLPGDRGPWSFPTLYLPYSGKLWGELPPSRGWFTDTTRTTG